MKSARVLTFAGVLLMIFAQAANPALSQIYNYSDREYLEFVRMIDENDYLGIKEKIEGCADPNTTRSDGETILMYAVKTGNSDITKLLIELGADVNARNLAGGTPLMYAASIDRADIAAQLIYGGANVREKDEYGRTALIIAMERGSRAIVKMLREIMDP
ncbi:MAG: ankyrin repeat domain-containing protein [Syntrophales bacterium]